MAHELFCFSFEFEIGANRLRIKFSIGKSNLFLSNIWAWYPEKQPNWKKWVQIEKKTTFVIYGRKTAKRQDQTFLTETCPGLVLVKWARLDFDSGPDFDSNHTLIFLKKCSKSAKSNPIFYWKGRGDIALPLTIWIARWLNLVCQCFYFSRFRPSSEGKRGSKRDQR